MQSQTHDVSLWKAWAWLETNKKQVSIIFSVAAAVGVIIWFIVYQRGQKQIAAGEAVSKVLVGQALEQQQAGVIPPENPDAYLKVASYYSGSSAGARALLIGGGALFAQGKYSEAQAQFEKFIPRYGDHPFMPQALLGIAACLDAQDKTNEAITAYRNIIDRHPNASVVPQAKMALARLYEGQNKPDLALPLLEDIARTDPYGSIGSEAGMLAEELKLKHPNLVPPAATVTNTFSSTVVPTNVAPTVPAVPVTGSTTSVPASNQ